MQLGYSSNEDSDKAILPPREHPCALIDVQMVSGLNYEKTAEVQQLRWTFEGTRFQSPDGKPGIISLWTGLSYGYSKAKITSFFDQLFGRSLTEQEARRIDPAKMVGVIKGYVMVIPHKKGDGTMTSKFGGFRVPDNAPPTDPEVFYGDEDALGAHSGPAPKLMVEENDGMSSLEDPFGE